MSVAHRTSLDLVADPPTSAQAVEAAVTRAVREMHAVYERHAFTGSLAGREGHAVAVALGKIEGQLRASLGDETGHDAFADALLRSLEALREARHAR